MRMPWGRYHDEPLENLPTDYLRYVAREADDNLLAGEAEKQLAMREGRGVVRKGDGRTQILGDE